jgi:hypothetical protein
VVHEEPRRARRCGVFFVLGVDDDGLVRDPRLAAACRRARDERDQPESERGAGPRREA